jgi:hypothetical protein
MKKQRTTSSKKPKVHQGSTTKPRSSSTAARRDNVLGRRPSKADPLGEQPGTLPSEQASPVKIQRDPDLRRPEDQVTNTDVSDLPVGGM